MKQTSKTYFDTQQLNAIPITEVAALFGTIDDHGKRPLAHCPWHDDQHPSLTLYHDVSQNRCHCFACGKSGDVISYVMQSQGCSFSEACQWLSTTFGIDTAVRHASQQIVTPPQSTAPVAKTIMADIPWHFVKPLISIDNSFSQCLLHLFDAEMVKTVTQAYCLCRYRYPPYDDDVLFLNIDTEGKVRNIKAQHYCTDTHTSDFFHCDKAHIFWIGKHLQTRGVVPAEASFETDILFGAHLLPQRPQTVVGLVESPKNAVVAACLFPELVWVATGNKSQLKDKVIEPLRGRDVVVYPDRDAIGEWTKKIESFGSIANFSVSDFCERRAYRNQPKFDIADYALGQIFPIHT